MNLENLRDFNVRPHHTVMGIVESVNVNCDAAGIAKYSDKMDHESEVKLSVIMNIRVIMI